MRGFQLTGARNLLRGELRRAAAVAQHHAYALDMEEVLDLAANGGDSARPNVLRRALVLSALAARSVTVGELAAAWKTTPEQIAAWRAFPLVDDTGIAAKIDAQVLERLPETPDVDRQVHAPAAT